MKPICYTLIGPPGCGKSTWRHENAEWMNDPEVISTDDMVEEIAAATGRRYHEVFSDVSYDDLVAKCRVKVARAVIAQRDIILDQTNYTVSRRMLFRKQIPDTYEMVGVVFEFDHAELIDRIAKREQETGKHIPRFVLDNMVNGINLPQAGEFDHIIEVKRGSNLPLSTYLESSSSLR